MVAAPIPPSSGRILVTGEVDAAATAMGWVRLI